MNEYIKAKLFNDYHDLAAEKLILKNQMEDDFLTLPDKEKWILLKKAKKLGIELGV